MKGIVPSVEIERSSTDKPKEPDHSFEVNLSPFLGRLFNLPKPSIVRSEYHLQPVAEGDNDVFRPLPWKGAWDWVALVGTFKNDPIVPPADSRESVRPTGSAKKVIARIVYFNRQESALEMNFGVWLSTLGGLTPFKVGDVRYLILALCERKKLNVWYAIEDCRNTPSSRLA